MAELLASPGVRRPVLRVGGRDDGFVAVADGRRRSGAADYRRAGQIAGGTGVGVRCSLPVIERVRRGGAQSLFLEVGVDNAPARSLYSQAGFVEVGRRPATTGANADSPMRSSCVSRSLHGG